MNRRDAACFVLGAGLSMALAIGIDSFLSDGDALEIRTIPRDVLAGRLIRGEPIGQTITDAPRFVHRVEVPFQRFGLTRDERVELRYRVDDADRQSRRAECAVPRVASGILTFELGDSILSADGVHHFELEPLLPGPSEVLVYTRYRALAADRRNPAPGSASCGAVNGALRAKADRLSGIAIAVTSLDPSRGKSALALFEEGRPDPVRVSRPEIPGRIADGWVFFPFEPIAGSRWANYRFRVALPPETGVMGRCDQPAWIALHGAPEPDARLGGMTWAGQPLADRDLCFAVRGRLGRGITADASERALLSMLPWSLAAGLVCLALARALRSCNARA